MKDEIKEILEDVKRHLDYVEATKQASIRDNEMKAMYDYITNLQTIEQQYSAILSENAELQQEKERLKLELSGYRTAILKDDKMLGLHQRISKAIEHIEENKYWNGDNYNCLFCEDLLEILKGSDKE